jgi:hypothetical protein
MAGESGLYQENGPFIFFITLLFIEITGLTRRR